MNQLMNDRGDCRTALSTLGLFKRTCHLEVLFGLAATPKPRGLTKLNYLLFIIIGIGSLDPTSESWSHCVCQKENVLTS